MYVSKVTCMFQIVWTWNTIAEIALVAVKYLQVTYYYSAISKKKYIQFFADMF